MTEAQRQGLGQAAPRRPMTVPPPPRRVHPAGPRCSKPVAADAGSTSDSDAAAPARRVLVVDDNDDFGPEHGHDPQARGLRGPGGLRRRGRPGSGPPVPPRGRSSPISACRASTATSSPVGSGRTRSFPRASGFSPPSPATARPSPGAGPARPGSTTTSSSRSTPRPSWRYWHRSNGGRSRSSSNPRVLRVDPAGGYVGWVQPTGGAGTIPVGCTHPTQIESQAALRGSMHDLGTISEPRNGFLTRSVTTFAKKTMCPLDKGGTAVKIDPAKKTWGGI